MDSNRQRNLRKRRASEGLARFIAISERRAAEVDALTRSWGLLGLATAQSNKAWIKLTEEAILEMEATLPLLREGMPGNAVDVRGGLVARVSIRAGGGMG